MERDEVVVALNIISKASKTKVIDWVIESYTDFPNDFNIVFVGDRLESRAIEKFIEVGFIVDVCDWCMEVH